MLFRQYELNPTLRILFKRESKQGDFGFQKVEYTLRKLHDPGSLGNKWTKACKQFGCGSCGSDYRLGMSLNATFKHISSHCQRPVQRLCLGNERSSYRLRPSETGWSHRSCSCKQGCFLACNKEQNSSEWTFDFTLANNSTWLKDDRASLQTCWASVIQSTKLPPTWRWWPRPQAPGQPPHHWTPSSYAGSPYRPGEGERKVGKISSLQIKNQKRTNDNILNTGAGRMPCL